MVKLTLGDKGKRLKWNFYFLGILLILILGTCHILVRIDWSAIPRREFVKHLHEIEDQIVLENVPPAIRVHKLIAACNRLLRSRGMAGYICNLTTGEFFYCGKISPAFRKGVELQKSLINSGQPFDEKSIPRLRVVVEFKKLNCRCLIADLEPREERLK